jgi:tetratricopeptide (TPR) repeat protein
MVVDPRHDHSFRIPRPDLSVETGAPNACNQCHADKDADWSAAQINQWYGKTPVGYQQFADALTAGRSGEPGAGAKLVELVNAVDTPDIAKATAISLMPQYLDRQTFSAIQQGLRHDDAMVRVASISALEGLQPSMITSLLFPLLDDPVRAVRIEAARVLAPVPTGELEGENKKIYQQASDEYLQSQQSSAERPEAQVNLGNYHAAKGDYENAKAAYREAIELEATFVPAYINLADLYRVLNDDKAAEAILDQGLAVAPHSASINHALGLLMIRQQQAEKAVDVLRHAAELEPANQRYTYVYAVALNSTGHKQAAIDAMQAAHEQFPNNTEILSALVAFHRDAGNAFAAEAYYNKLQKLSSDR